MSTIQDTDILLVNRGGTDYKVKAEDLHEYFNPPPWWQDHIGGIFHVIVTDPNDINVVHRSVEGIVDLATGQKVTGISYAGEFIVLTKLDALEAFKGSTGDFKFGDLTDTSQVTGMQSLLNGATLFNSDVSMFDTSNVKNMQEMFKNARAFNQDINNWDVSNVTNMNEMLFNAKAFNQYLKGWCVTNFTSYPMNFRSGTLMPLDSSKDPCWGHCPRGENGTVDPCPDAPWAGAMGIYHVIISDPAAIRPAGHERIYNVDTKAEVTGITYPGEFIITGRDTVFANSTGNWQFGPLTDTSKVIGMNSMFHGAYAFNSDLSMFDTSKVINMSHMFDGAASFNQDISNWDVSDVSGEDGMGHMFYGATSFTQDLSGWCVRWIKSKPRGFGSGFVEPCWGHCPRGEGGTVDPCP